MSGSTRIDRKFSYLVASFLRTLTRRNLECPSCGGGQSNIVARKYLVTSLRRCSNCQLLFRAPTTSPAVYAGYYQEHYTSGLTTDLPDDGQLRQYMACGFSNTEKDFSRYLEILDSLGVEKGARVLDYGCSWGYGCWQLKARGFDVLGYDVSKPRVAYGREKLGVDLVSDINQVVGPFDVFFSTHVVEHVPGVAGLMRFALSTLDRKGIFVAVTPNGSLQYRAKNARRWSRVWGFKHPILVDEVFLTHSLRAHPFLATTRLRDLQSMTDWASSEGSVVEDMTGWELLLAVRPRQSPVQAT